MLDKKQAFKAAFIARCIEAGHTTPEEVLGQVKVAQEKLAGILGDITGAGKGALSVAGKGLRAALPLAVLAPPILGGTAGYLAAKTTDIDDTDVEEAKNQEILDELRRQTERLLYQRKAKEYAHSIPRFHY